MPAVSNELQNAILARQRQGATISAIALELGISRTTVYKSLTAVDNWESWVKDKSNNIRRLAYNAVEKGLTKGDARLGLDWLKLTDLAQTTSTSYHFSGDARLTQVVSLLPQSSTPSTAITIDSTSTLVEATGTEAAAKPPGSDINISSHTNFSNFSTDQLLDELRRRGVQV